MADFRRIARVFCVAAIVALAVCQKPVAAQSTETSDLRKDVEQLQAQVKALQAELDEIKAILREQSARTNPVVDVGGDPVMGDAGAKLVLVEFSDFECPYCLEYYKTTYRQVIDNYVKTGKIRYVFADFPGEKNHPHAIRAAEAGHCATEQGKFWEMHDQLFAHQRDFATTGFDDAAHASGLNEAQFESCLSAGKYADAIHQAEDTGVKLGIQGTPAFVIGTPDPANPTKIKVGRGMVGAQPYATFQQTIDGLLPK